MRSTKRLLGASVREFQTFFFYLVVRKLFICVCLGSCVMFFKLNVASTKQYTSWKDAQLHGIVALPSDKSETSSGNIIKDTQTFATFQLGIHINWWHVTVCYLVGGYLISEVQEIYDNQVSNVYLCLAFYTFICTSSKVCAISMFRQCGTKSGFLTLQQFGCWVKLETFHEHMYCSKVSSPG